MAIVATAAAAVVRLRVLPVTVAIAGTVVIAVIAAGVPQIRLRVVAAMAAVVRGLLRRALLRQPLPPRHAS